MDEAAAKLRTEMDSMPSELDAVQCRVMQLEIERKALRKESDDSSKERLSKLERILAEDETHAKALMAQWHSEQEDVQRLRSVREQIEQTKTAIERAER